MNLIFRFLLALFLGGASASFALAPGSSIAQAAAAQAPMLLPVDETPLTIERNGEIIARFEIEIADDAAERSRGLMFREFFPDNRGMLFVFDQSRDVSFWMRNTPRSLDMLFIGRDGELRAIARDTTPFSIEPVPSGGPVLYVLEINAGLSARYGLQPGDRIAHPIISSEAD